MSTVFAPIAWTPTPDPPPDTWMSAFGCAAIYWSAAFWTIGRTVVEPLILMVCFWPDATGAAVAAGAVAVTIGVAIAVVMTAVGTAVAAGVAAGAVVPLLVQPAIASAHDEQREQGSSLR